MNDTPITLDELDLLANDVFPGLVVRKDLLRRMRSAFGARLRRWTWFRSSLGGSMESSYDKTLIISL